MEEKIMASKKILTKILSFTLVLVFVLSTFVFVMPTSTSAVTQNQQNIVDRANYLWNSTWVCKKTVKGWTREKKNALISAKNPAFDDISPAFL